MAASLAMAAPSNGVAAVAVAVMVVVVSCLSGVGGGDDGSGVRAVVPVATAAGAV